MMRRLQAQIVIVCALAIFAVLGTIIGVSEHATYGSMVRSADAIIDVIAGNGGTMPKDPDAFRSVGISDRQYAEAPYESRWFVVTDDDIASADDANVDTSSIVRVDDDTAREYARRAAGSGEERGFIDGFRYRVTEDAGGGTMVVFLDRGRQIATFDENLHNVEVAAMCGALAILVVVGTASRRIISPIFESQEKQRRFVSDAGHDIKTPLSVISADAEVLALEVGESEWIDDIRRQVGVLTRLTNDLMFLSRMDSDIRNAPRAEVDMTEVVRDQVSSFSTVAHVDGKEIEGRIDDGVTLWAEPKSMRQLASVLIDNAVKYSSDEAPIEVSLSGDRRQVRLSVSNACEPGKLTHVDKWFDRFYQEDASRTAGRGGFGIGLSMAQAIVTGHRGRIEARADGNRLTIAVTLPGGSAPKERGEDGR